MGIVNTSFSVEGTGFTQDFDAWLDALATEPLPGGVAAAAVGSAMGAALVAKATRVTLQRQNMPQASRAALQTVLDLARNRQKTLMLMAKADEDAYRAMLDSQALEISPTARGELWQKATQSPISVAETCHALLQSLPQVFEVCWPAVEPDLETGRQLLVVGLRAGLSAAKSNLQSWGSGPEAQVLWTRMAALSQEQQP